MIWYAMQSKPHASKRATKKLHELGFMSAEAIGNYIILESDEEAKMIERRVLGTGDVLRWLGPAGDIGKMRDHAARPVRSMGFKVGDRVSDASDQFSGQVTAIRGRRAWVKTIAFNRETTLIASLENLRKVG